MLWQIGNSEKRVTVVFHVWNNSRECYYCKDCLHEVKFRGGAGICACPREEKAVNRIISGVVGLDLSYTSTGLARMARLPKPLTKPKWGVFGTKTDDGTSLVRCVKTAKVVLKVVQENDVVFIEGYAYGVAGKQQRLAMLGELNGIIKLVILKRTKKQPLIVAPGTWKKFLCGNGHLAKDEFKLQVFKKFGVECKTNDEAVAIAIADFGWHVFYQLGTRRDLKKYEEKCLKDYWKRLGPVIKAIVQEG